MGTGALWERCARRGVQPGCARPEWTGRDPAPTHSLSPVPASARPASDLTASPSLKDRGAGPQRAYWSRVAELTLRTRYQSLQAAEEQVAAGPMACAAPWRHQGRRTGAPPPGACPVITAGDPLGVPDFPSLASARSALGLRPVLSEAHAAWVRETGKGAWRVHLGVQAVPGTLEPCGGQRATRSRGSRGAPALSAVARP